MPESPKQISISFLLLIYFALIALLLFTVGGASLSLGKAALLVALAIAFAKALLVILYFMHLRFSSRLTWLFAAAGFLWLTILFSLTFADYLTRSWLPRTQDIAANPSALPAPPGITPTHPDPSLTIDFHPSPASR